MIDNAKKRLEEINEKIKNLRSQRATINSEVDKCSIDREIEILGVEKMEIKYMVSNKIEEKIEHSHPAAIKDNVAPQDEVKVEDNSADKTVNGVEEPVVSEEVKEESKPQEFKNNKHKNKYYNQFNDNNDEK